MSRMKTTGHATPTQKSGFNLIFVVAMVIQIFGAAVAAGQSSDFTRGIQNYQNGNFDAASIAFRQSAATLPGAAAARETLLPASQTRAAAGRTAAKPAQG